MASLTNTSLRYPPCIPPSVLSRPTRTTTRSQPFIPAPWARPIRTRWLMQPTSAQGSLHRMAEMLCCSTAVTSQRSAYPSCLNPGQNLPLFSKDELLTCIDQATWCVMNDYESQLMIKITELTLDDIANQVHALIVTRGGEGSRIYASNKSIDIPASLYRNSCGSYWLWRCFSCRPVARPEL